MATSRTTAANQTTQPPTTPPTPAPVGGFTGNTLPPEGIGFRCGVCGRVVGREGQHYGTDGEITATPHANVLVVADDWADRK